MMFLRWVPFGAYVASVMGGISSETGYLGRQGKMSDLIGDGRLSAFYLLTKNTVMFLLVEC